MANSPWGKDRGSNRPSGGGGPSGNTPGGGGKKPGFDLDSLVKRSHEHMSGWFGGDNEGRAVWAILGIVGALWLASGVYRVNSDELGVVLRFGKYQRTTTAGLNYHLPYPIEQVIIPSVTSVNKVEIGSRSGRAENPGVRTARSSLSAGADAAKLRSPQNPEGLMLTADRNIVDIDFEVQWKIDGTAPEKFLFNVRNAAGSVHSVAESAMREVIGHHKLDEILTGAQSQVAEETRTIMQKMLDSYGAGIEIIAVNLSRPDVPGPVIDEFQDVKRAQQDKQTAESVAEGYSNQILPKAKGEAQQMIEQAEAYKSQVVANAQGDAARFGQIYTQYALAKDVTRRRMYLETMEEVLKGMPKMIVDAGKGGIVTQMMPVPVLKNAVAVAAPGTVPPTSAIVAPAAQEDR